MAGSVTIDRQVTIQFDNGKKQAIPKSLLEVLGQDVVEAEAHFERNMQFTLWFHVQAWQEPYFCWQ